MYWDESLETTIPVIDQQHKEMFYQLDLLLDYTNVDRVDDTLAFLAGYVVKHFGTEELMQRSSRYPYFDEHKKLHDDFVIQYTRLKKEYDAEGKQALILEKLIKIIHDWLQDHIMNHDRDFAVYFKDYCAKAEKDEREAADTRVISR